MNSAKGDGSDIDSLFDAALLKHNSKQAEEKRESLSKKDWLAARRLAKTNLFWLASGPLHYDRLSPNLHGHYCQWLQANEGSRFILTLLPRLHFKTTIKTISDSIRYALPDDVGDCIYPANLGPDIRILINHAVDDKAAAFLYEIAAHFTTNVDLMALFPEVVPVYRKTRANKYELELNGRPTKWKETTFTASGVTASAQGGHFNLIQPDDIIGDKERDSEAHMRRIQEWVDNIQAFFVKLAHDKIHFTGTHYGPGDIYEHIKERYGKQLKVYRRSIEEPTGQKDKKGNPVLKPVFEEITTESLEILKKNPRIYATQFQNDPSSGLAKFKQEWLNKRFTYETEYTISFRTTELSAGRLIKRDVVKRTSIDDMAVLILHDPATTGESGTVIVGTDENKNHFVLEAHQEVWTPDQFCERVFSWVLKYNPWCVGVESVLFSSLYEPWFLAEMKVRGIYFNVMPVPAGSQLQKDARVFGLAPLLQAGQIYLANNPNSLPDAEVDNIRYTIDPVYREPHLLAQMKRFGVIKGYHVLDSLGMLPNLAKPGMLNTDRVAARQRSIDKISNRDPRTGYSRQGNSMRTGNPNPTSAPNIIKTLRNR